MKAGEETVRCARLTSDSSILTSGSRSPTIVVDIDRSSAACPELAEGS